MGVKKLNILLVDDEEKFLNSMVDRIKLKGYEPFAVRSGREALEVAGRQQLHVAVVDLRMPDMDGLVTITKLKELQPDIKTILLTGFGDEKVREATEALNSSYFEKHEMGTFWSFVRKVLRGLENGMAAAGMASGGDPGGALQISSREDKEKE